MPRVIQILAGRRAVAAVAVLAELTVILLPMAVPVSAAPPQEPRTGWTAERSGTGADLTSVSFPDARHGHAVGYGGTIIATTDGGRSWTREFACAESAPCVASSPDRIADDLLSVSFANSRHGWATGSGGTILGTEDGGATWTPELACAQTSAATVRTYCTALSADRVTKALTSVSFVDPAHGWAVGAGETILRTDDGGRTWVLQIACLWRPSGLRGPCPPRPAGTPPHDLDGVSFVDRQHGVAVGSAGYAFFTSDGGQTWTGGPSTVALDLRGVDVVVAGYSPRPMTVHAVGADGLVLVSGAKGPTWYGTGGSNELTGQGQPTSTDLHSVSFTDRLNGWAVGAGGVILATHDEGVSWAVESGTAADLHGVDFPDANHGFAVGAGGTVLAFRATPPGVLVRAVSPRQLPVDGRLPVTITGRGFTGAAEVSFGKTWARGYSVDSDTRITAIPPPLPAGPVHITVSSRGSTSQIGDADEVTFLPAGGGQWSGAGQCHAKCNGAAVVLHDGRVLIVAARGDTPAPSREVELYDPTLGAMRQTAPLQLARWDATVTLLRDGRVLMAGGVTYGPNGVSVGAVTPTVEVYDPRTGRWSWTGSMHEARAEATAARLADGEVLVAGGNDAQRKTVLASDEVYNPATGTWREAAPMHHARAYATALLLDTGEVLVAGNRAQPEDASAELFDPQRGTWRSTGSMALAVSFPTLALLADGKVLASGGLISPPFRPMITVPYAQIYDPITRTWKPTGPMLYASVFHAAATLADGRVLVAGGLIDSFLYCPPCDPLSQAEIFDPVTGAWRVVSPMSQPEEMPALAVTGGGDVVMAGSDGGVEVFTPSSSVTSNAGEVGPWIAAPAAGVLSLAAIGALWWRVRRRARSALRRQRPGLSGTSNAPKPVAAERATEANGRGTVARTDAMRR